MGQQEQTIAAHAAGKRIDSVGLLIRIAIPLIAVGAFINDGRAFNLSSVSALSASQILVAFTAYGLSHVFRAVRLAAVATRIMPLTFRTLFLLHFHTAIVILVVPFKLGELYRLRELAALSQDSGRAVLVVFVERAADSMPLIVLCAVLLSIGTNVPTYLNYTAAMLAAILLAAFFMLTVVAPVLLDIQKYVFKHHVSNAALATLRVISSLRQAIEVTRRCIEGNSLLILGLTVVIWSLELVTVAAVFSTSDLGVGVFVFDNVLLALTPSRDVSAGSYSLVEIWFVFLVAAWIASMLFYPTFIRRPLRTVTTAKSVPSFKPPMKRRRTKLQTRRVRHGL